MVSFEVRYATYLKTTNGHRLFVTLSAKFKVMIKKAK